jgi:hypothetical protein
VPEDHLDNSVIFIDTVLQYHLCLPDPDVLSDAEWAMKYAILIQLIKSEKQ